MNVILEIAIAAVLAFEGIYSIATGRSFAARNKPINHEIKAYTLWRRIAGVAILLMSIMVILYVLNYAKIITLSGSFGIVLLVSILVFVVVVVATYLAIVVPADKRAQRSGNGRFIDED